jgi:hypothetical protein
LSHASLKGSTRACARKEKEHRQDLVPQVRMRFTQGSLSLQIQRNFEDGLYLFLAEVKITNEIATT